MNDLDLELVSICDQCQNTDVTNFTLCCICKIIWAVLVSTIAMIGQRRGDEKEPRTWNVDERGLVKTIADQCAIAIHQAQLHQHVQDLNTNLAHQVEERTAQLQQKMRELERLNSLKDDFLSTVSHELRTPMSNIKMAIHMLSQFPLRTAPTPLHQNFGC